MSAPTQLDVAQASGFARRTVSMVFAGHHSSLDPDTVAQIKRAARTVGYVHTLKDPRSDLGKSKPTYLTGSRCIHGVEGGCVPCNDFIRDFKYSVGGFARKVKQEAEEIKRAACAEVAR